MNDFCVVYYDLVEIAEEICSVVNINNYGSLHYRKQKLVQYHQSIFKNNRITQFYHIASRNDIEEFINYHSHSSIHNFIFFASSFVIVDSFSFSDFLNRIKHIDSPLAICKNDEIYSFLKLGKKQVLNLMEMLLLGESNLNNLLIQNYSSLEKFKKENFYLQISNYITFVKFLHSNFELRYFNSLQGNGLTITKSSSKKTKMLNEYKYYDFVPESLKIYFLRPFNFIEDEHNASYSLEQLNVPDLAIQWIHYSINPTQFKILIERIFTFLGQRPHKKSNRDVVQEGIRNLYLVKLQNRLTEFKNSMVFAQIDAIVAKCTVYSGIDDVLAYYVQLFEKIDKLRKNELNQHFGHGDLCFSNILYDKRIDFIKFIDPKGCTSEKDAYFDSYYDVAKLSHSILGNYDYINNGIFNIDIDNNLNMSINIPVPENQKEYEIIFIEFLEKNQFDYKLVRLYEASLFLSMLPLHIDYPKKVLAFILTAISILNSLDK